MFEIPGAGISRVHVTEEYVKGETGPIYIKNTNSSETLVDEEEIKSSIRI